MVLGSPWIAYLELSILLPVVMMEINIHAFKISFMDRHE
jgi:hypothetical protein